MNRFRISFMLSCSIILIIWSTMSLAHHSYAAFFDMEGLSELEGVVTKVHWYNPHVNFVLKE